MDGTPRSRVCGSSPLVSSSLRVQGGAALTFADDLFQVHPCGCEGGTLATQTISFRSSRSHVLFQ